MTLKSTRSDDKYPLAMRLLHWLRALLIFGQIWAGWFMVSLKDEVPAKFALFYPYHKSVGVLLLGLSLVQLLLHLGSTTPSLPPGLSQGEVVLSRIVHRSIYVLLILTPLMGYAMSSSFTQSDGVFFFGVNLPELLPKNDHNFEIFRWAHRVMAYLLLALVLVHVAGALKHRFLGRDSENDVLRRMI